MFLRFYLKSSVIGKYFFAESAVVYIVSIMNIQMYFDLLLFSKHFPTRQTHKFSFPRAGLNHRGYFETHVPLFNIPTIGNSSTKIDMLTQMLDQGVLLIESVSRELNHFINSPLFFSVNQ